jgi:hypothetical protein
MVKRAVAWRRAVRMVGENMVGDYGKELKQHTTNCWV